MDLARIFPESEEELLLVNGIGQNKLKEYGKILLKIVADFLRENPGAKSAKNK